MICLFNEVILATQTKLYTVKLNGDK
jgi:hypothetical protein